jgi:hypothetical protein
MNLRSFVLTWRMHRFEVLFSAGLLAAFAVWVWMVSQQMLDLDIPGTCWPRTVDGDWASAGCNDLMDTFWGYQSGAGYPRVGLALLAPVVGLLLGVPIVAREIELRTTELAWSLALRRSRWLLARLLPMLALALVGFVVLGWLGERLFAAMEVGRAKPDLTEVASYGPALVARGLMALGIGLLAGALVGRTLPALVVGAVVVLAWSLVAVPMVQHSMFADRAMWVNENDAGWREGAGPIAYLESGMFDPSQPGVDGEPGARLDEERDWSPMAEAACGPYPEVYDDSPEVRAYEECNQTFWGNLQWSLAVPASAYGHFQAVETGLGLAIGLLALLVTFPVVSRRRPT